MTNRNKNVFGTLFWYVKIRKIYRTQKYMLSDLSANKVAPEIFFEYGDQKFS